MFRNIEYVQQLRSKAEENKEGLLYPYLEVLKIKGKSREGTGVQIKINMALNGKSTYVEIESISK